VQANEQGAAPSHSPFGPQVSGVLPAHRLTPGVQVPVHWPVPLQTNSHLGCGSHVPLALQSSGVRFAPQRRSPGAQEPAHEPLEQRFWQTAPRSDHRPAESHACGCRPLGPLQRLVPGIHSPLQSPWPEQANSQRFAATHSRFSLQASGVWSCPHRFSPGLHAPEQPPSLQPPSNAPASAAPVAASVASGVALSCFGAVGSFAPSGESGLAPSVWWPLASGEAQREESSFDGVQVGHFTAQEEKTVNAMPMMANPKTRARRFIVTSRALVALVAPLNDCAVPI
jgi:hypothetical protein